MASTFRAELWLHDGGSWHFVTLPHDLSDEIDDLTASTSRGFGSVRVSATIGSTTWATSIFPSKEEASFVLPIKKSVRTTESLDLGAIVEVHLALVDTPDLPGA